uniref:Fibulin-1 n=1 Tax=Callorhinchus milii TaxID=7868 RepID=A0A4W3IV68_CALMI
MKVQDTVGSVPLLHCSVDNLRAQTYSECCSNGIRLASETFECDALPQSDLPYCSLAQETCCLVKLEDIQCFNGKNMASVNQTCDTQAPNMCQTTKRCCQCCLLGKHAQDQQLGCEAAQFLEYNCRQIYRECCDGEETTSTNPLPDNNTLRDPALGTGTNSDEVEEVWEATQEVEDPFLNDRCRGGGPCKQQCTDTGTTVICTCDVGYKLKADGITCEDLNECLTSKHQCQTGERCINTVGSYRCQREISCGTGYELTENNQCRDIDECETGTHNCGFNFLCQNTQGSFRCRPKMQCGTGFLQDAQGSCIDIDECVSSARACRAGYNCFNTIGSFVCQRNNVNCGRGYRFSDDASRCVDIDECVARSNPCGEGHFCVNSPGSYRCECRIGYFFDSISRSCIDENECRHYPGRLCAHNCENTQGSYHCSCSKGFKLSIDKRNCEDVNECEGNPCSQECANMYGSYQCYCRSGYRLSDTDGITCEDIDECALPAGGNICSYRCINVPGSFKCSCPSTGYNLAQNGRSCQDIDECITGRHDCSDRESCFNVQGSFRCMAFKCPENYRKSSETATADGTETFRCIKFCRPNDAVCILDPVNTISDTVISLPTYRDFTEAIEIIFLRASSSNFPKAQAEIMFRITDGNFHNSFDILKRKEGSLTVGIVRMVKPIIGPYSGILKLEMDYYLSGQLSHRNVVNVHIYISENWF